MARKEFQKRMENIGAVIEVDDLANMYATIPGTDAEAPRIVMGSHADSVKTEAIMTAFWAYYRQWKS